MVVVVLVHRHAQLIHKFALKPHCVLYYMTCTSYLVDNRVNCHSHFAARLGCQGDVGPKHPEARSRSIVAAVAAYWRNRCCHTLSAHLHPATLILLMHLRMLDAVVTANCKLIGILLEFHHQLQMLAHSIVAIKNL